MLFNILWFIIGMIVGGTVILFLAAIVNGNQYERGKHDYMETMQMYQEMLDEEKENKKKGSQ